MKRLSFSVAVLLIAISCSGKDEDVSTEANADTDAAPADRYAVESTVIMEGDQPIEVAVEKIEPEDFPFLMYVTTGAQRDVTCDDSRCELVLHLPEEAAGTAGASLHLFVLSELTSSEEDEAAVTGSGGLFEQQGWRATGEITEGQDLIAPTVRKRIDFESADGATAGFVLFADVESEVVRVVAIAPAGNARLQGLAGISVTTLVRSGAA